MYVYGGFSMEGGRNYQEDRLVLHILRKPSTGE